MDTYRGRETVSEPDYSLVDDSAIEAPPRIGGDERRMHVRAYNYWVSLLGDRSLPAIADLNPEAVEDFGPHSVLLDFGRGIDDPHVAFLGGALRRECEIEGHIERISEVPARSLLSRLTDHYLQILANAAPIGFEAEFINQRGIEIMYRGILMPFSSNGEAIDFVYGVINWKEVAHPDLTDALVREVDEALRSAPKAVGTAAVWADGPSSRDGGPADVEAEAVELDEEAELGDWLALARDGAQVAGTSIARGRSALYRAISLSYDFWLATRRAPDDYAELLDDAGIKVQARSPMTAVIKLVFGSNYDKTRITEYATALDYAADRAMPAGELASYLETYEGGLKGLVRDARAARRPASHDKPDRSAVARTRLKAQAALDPSSVATDADGLAVVVARRESDGTLNIIAALPADAALTRRVVEAAAHPRG